MRNNDIRYNGSGYSDPTVDRAYRNIRKDRGYMARKVIKTLYNVSHLAGFEIVGKIKLRDTETGEEFR